MSKRLGSRADVDRLIASISRLPDTRAAIAREVAPALTELAQASFAKQESPYGEPWPPGSHGNELDLVEVGNLRALAVKYTATGTRVRATVASLRYAKYHIRRGILPRNGVLPLPWEERIRAIANRHLEGTVG